MFETLSYLALQQYWWIIISLLGSLLVFLLFVQGGQTLIYTIGKTELERTMIVNTLGRKWEFTFTTLVTFGGAFFSSFPLFYSTSFGGAYWLWMFILFCFIIQAISYEYRSKPDNFLGRRTYETFLFINGALGTFLLGVAVGTFFTGSEFSVNKMNLVNISDNVISQWKNTSRGLEAVLNIQNIALGLSVFFLSRILGLLYFMNSIHDKNIVFLSKKHLWYNAPPFLIAFLFFMAMLLLSDGYSVKPISGEVFMEPYKYLHNLLEMPVVLILSIAGVALVLLSILRTLFSNYIEGIWFAGVGTVLVVFNLFITAGFNNTAYYPSSFDLQSSLTIRNSSSSYYTLIAMSYVSLLVPFVLGYIYYAWKSINNKKIDADEMREDIHIY